MSTPARTGTLYTSSDLNYVIYRVTSATQPSVQSPSLFRSDHPTFWLFCEDAAMHATLNEPLMRATDVQAILRLVGGAAELWYQPSLQRQFTLDSLCKLMRAKVGICFTWGDAMVGGQ